MLLEILSLIGLSLSVYSIYVEYKLSKSKKYKALCDFGKKASCTRAFSSKFGKIFGISNSFLGFMFYIMIFSLSFYNQINYIFYLSALSLPLTIYLLYSLYFKLKDFCLVCTAIYIVNFLILIFSYLSI